MSEETPRVERDRQLILGAKQEGTGAKLWVYTKLSGPGWIQSAITLGGGSLAGSLYLGVLAGFGLMWLQPLAMILGVVMLSAIGYVALSTGERPFDAINRHVNPVLGWGWAIATLMANLVWCMPQFALATAALRQNLLPDQLGKDSGIPENQAMSGIIAVILVVTFVVTWFYNSGGWGVKLVDVILKLMVGVIVLCFFGVVFKMSVSGDGLAWGQILGGFIPDLSLLTKPSPAFAEVLSSTGEYQQYWTGLIVKNQQKVMITAAATAVGINMTFLLPYSMLSRGWDRDFRGLAMFDLSTGLFVPFLLATSCVVIASASQFHAKEAPGLVAEDSAGVEPAKNLLGGYNKAVDARIKEKFSREYRAGEAAFSDLSDDELIEARTALPLGDRRIAAMLVTRDAFNLADALKPLTGKGVAQYVFGIGVVGMAVSSIIVLMLINGFVVCEMLGLPSQGNAHRAGCLLAGLTGAAGPFLWAGDAKVWLAVPTSMFGMVLLPIAYFTFLMMMNSKSLLGENLPRGGKRVCWNLLMGAAAGLAAFGSYTSIMSSPFKTLGFGLLGGFIALAVVVHVVRLARSK
ncbi:MAG: hypothetical protein CMJ48_07335 [Planctomycetaceae bacterium]|nr:hypothetical protein [Planctomycetaceae bacterium]